MRLCALFCLVLTLFTAGACKRNSHVSQEVLPANERVAPSPVGTEQIILHKTFTVAYSVGFPFTVPPHAARPHLQGTFQSFVHDANHQSDDAANLDFLVLSQDQHEDFVHGRPSEALFSAEASHNQEVNFDLPSSLDQPVKYFLIFRASPGGVPNKIVEADFHVDF
jgi:hypothetical protein